MIVPLNVVVAARIEYFDQHGSVAHLFHATPCNIIGHNVAVGPDRT
jgi:hypothetical protein